MPYDIYSKDGADAAFAPKDGVLDGGTASAPLYDIRIRHDDTAGWAAEDPILSLGEEGIDVDTGTRKVGDGVTAWSSLPASGGGGGGGLTIADNGDGTLTLGGNSITDNLDGTLTLTIGA